MGDGWSKGWGVCIVIFFLLGYGFFGGWLRRFFFIGGFGGVIFRIGKL